MKIAVILPTRGLVFAEVEHFIEKQRGSYDITVYRSWNRTLPDAQNYLVEKALGDKPDYLFFVEEDTVMPPDALDLLLLENSDIACIDYGVNGWSCTARERETKELLWCGMGCTLVKREVLEAMEKPYFRSDLSLRLNDWKWVPNREPYGQQDIRFCMMAREKGFKISQVPGVEAKHMRLDQLGRIETNKGLHQLSQKSIIAKQQYVDIPEEHDYFLTVSANL
jgi:hypothetical protein